MSGDTSRQLGMMAGWQVLQEGTCCHKAEGCCAAHQRGFQVQGVALCIPPLAFGGGADAAHGGIHRDSCRESRGRSTLSVPLPGAGVAAKALPLKASRWPGGRGLLQPPYPTGGDPALPSHPTRTAHAVGFPLLPPAAQAVTANPSLQEW